MRPSTERSLFCNMHSREWNIPTSHSEITLVQRKLFPKSLLCKSRKQLATLVQQELFANDCYENPESSRPLWSKRAFFFLQMTAMKIQKAVGHFDPTRAFCKWLLCKSRKQLATLVQESFLQMTTMKIQNAVGHFGPTLQI